MPASGGCLFSGAISGATEAEIHRAAELAGLGADIADFPKGFDTIVGERGVLLSGGQKQRVAIARALVKNPSILIFDDALSSVDSATEQRILDHLATALEGRTTILITHRLSSVRRAGYVIVLEGGQVADGRFPNRSPDCSRSGNLGALRAAVVAGKASLGIAWDGDGDRVAFVDETGTHASTDEISILLLRHVLQNAASAEPVVCDIKLSDAVRRAVLSAGGQPLLERSGHAFMRRRLLESGSLLGLDACGHLFLPRGWLARRRIVLGSLPAGHPERRAIARGSAAIGGTALQHSRVAAARVASELRRGDGPVARGVSGRRGIFR